MNYLFETSEFGLLKDSFHLLRSSYNYKTYKKDEIATLTIENGKQINNWILVLLIGVLLIVFSIYYTISLYDLMTDETPQRIYREQFLVPLLPFFGGFYCLYVSLIAGPVINIHLNSGNTKKFPLSKVKKNNQLDKMIEILTNSTEFGGKLKVTI